MEIEQKRSRNRSVLEAALPMEEVHRLLAVHGHVEVADDSRLAQCFRDQQHVIRVVFDQKDLDALANAHRAGPAQSGIVRLKIEPPPGAGSCHNSPPSRSTILLDRARPIPVPGYVAPCRRWNIRNADSTCCGSIPMPLSRTEKRQAAASLLAESSM